MTTHWLTLIGILIVVVGFVLRFNPLLVVAVAGVATGLASGMGGIALGALLISRENRYYASEQSSREKSSSPSSKSATPDAGNGGGHDRRSARC